MLSAVLAILVGFLIVMLAFYISTIEKIPIFACMKALGASGMEVVSILVSQAFIVFVLGSSLAGLGIHVAQTILEQDDDLDGHHAGARARGAGDDGALLGPQLVALDPESDHHRPRRGVPHMRTGETVLRLHDVDKEFREPQGILHVLKRLRLTVRRGEILMITGPSGSGKTTMLQIAGCLIRPTSGSVELAGRELGEASEGERLEARRRAPGVRLPELPPARRPDRWPRTCRWPCG